MKASIYDKGNKTLIPNNNTLSINVHAQDITIFTDPLRVQQILVNLIDNALKFTEEGNVYVDIKYTKEPETITFFVKDTGIGLTAEKKELIFKRFTKLEDDMKKLYRGAGLGLAICKNIVELLGGEIWVESKENKGSTFYVSIPLS